jgi:hypothetical protein
MLQKLKLARPSPAMIVAIVALIVALGGTAIAGGVLNKKKVNKIISNRAAGLSVASAKRADKATNADNAANADKLAGLLPSAFQGSCKAGAIKGTLVVDTSGFTSTTFQDKPGFNCFQPGNTATSVQLKHAATVGVYIVRFVGNSGSDATGSAVCSGLVSNVSASCTSEAGTGGASGETVFRVSVFNSGTGPVDNQAFSLLAF